MLAVSQNLALREQVHQLIIAIRKASAQQRHLEETCKQTQMVVEFRWSLNHHNTEQVSAPDYLPVRQEPLI